MIRKLWDGGNNDEIIARMDTDDLRIRQSSSKLEILSKTVLDIIGTMEEEKEKHVFDFTAMTCTHDIIRSQEMFKRVFRRHLCITQQSTTPWINQIRIFNGKD